MTIRDTMQSYLSFIQNGDYLSLEKGLKRECFDLSNADAIVELQRLLVEQKTPSLVECNLAILEAYLATQPNRAKAYDTFRAAAKTASSHPLLPPKAELSVILLD